MKKLVKLTALLLALAMCVFTAGALAESTLLGGTVYEGTQTNVDNDEYNAALTADELAAQALYEQIMASSDLAAILDMMVADGNNGAVALTNLKAEHLNGIKQHVDALYAVIDDPAQMADDFYTFDECYEVINEMLYALANGLGIELYAAGEATGNMTAAAFLAAASNGKITLKGNVKITDNSSIIIPAGATYTIDLNGFVLQGNGTKAVIANNGTLNIEDSNPNSVHYGNLANRSYFFELGEEKFNRNVSDAVWVYEANATSGTAIYGGIITGGKHDVNNGEPHDSKTNGGGGIHNKGIVNLKAGTIAGCESTAYGGGVYSGDGSEFHITNGRIMYNWCNQQTGGIYVYGGEMTMSNGHIDHNACAGTGGGVRVDKTKNNNATFTMTGGTIDHNRAMGNKRQVGNGGGVYSENGGSFTFSGGSISYNYAYNRGGGIDFWNAGTFTLDGDCKVIGNVAGYRGGGISIAIYDKTNSSGVTLNIKDTDVEISGNQAPFGGGISIVNGDFNMSAGSVKDNYATMEPKGILHENTDLSSSDTAKGGAVYIENGTALLTGGTLSNNSSTTNGGGIYIQGGMLDARGTTISNNRAAMYGGAAYVADLTIGEQSGSSIYLADASVVIAGGTISNNNAESGGAIYVVNRVDDIVVDKAEGTATSKDTSNATVYKLEGNWQDSANVTVSDGKINSNKASENGGAIAVELGDFTLAGGTLSGNKAGEAGGAIFVASGKVDVTGGVITGGITEGLNAQQGGAVYVTGGNFTMSNGEMTDNKANDGGAVYVNGGNYTMYHGKVNANDASNNGGAVYLTGDVNAVLTMESGEMNDNESGNDGGAIYANGGKLYIGLKGCDGVISDPPLDEDQEMHSDKGEGRHHPQMHNNIAAQCGGGIAISKVTIGDTTYAGEVHFYCGHATDNDALYKGYGKNVFMNGGDFYLYDGSNVGIPRDPDLVIIGGELHDETVEKDYVKVKFHSANQNYDETVFEGLVEHDLYFNLPDAEHFWTAPEGKEFLGWTAKGVSSGEMSTVVRQKADYISHELAVYASDTETYKEDGKIVQQPAWDGSSTDEAMHLYALWAPKTSKITYVNGRTFEIVEGHAPEQYNFTKVPYSTISIPAITDPGYVIAGWYVYQNVYEAGTLKEQNANWGLEPVYTSATEQVSTLDLEAMGKVTEPEAQYKALSNLGAALTLEVGNMRFGDITLVAKMVPAYSNLKINKTGWNNIDENQSFIFRIVGEATDPNADDVDMFVTISFDDASGETESVLVKQLPVGEYTITEQSGWSWRYSAGDGAEQTKQLTKPDETVEATFTNNREATKWLDGDCYKENTFNVVSTN